jgi:hypothetical protein
VSEHESERQAIRAPFLRLPASSTKRATASESSSAILGGGDGKGRRRETTAIAGAEMHVNHSERHVGVRSLRFSSAFLSFMVTHGQQTADALASMVDDKYFHLSSHDSTACLFHPPRFSLPMGRRSWATSDQLKFLESYLPQLPEARGGIGLNVLYTSIAQEFLTRWEPEPVTPAAVAKAVASTAKTVTSTVKTVTPENLKELAEIRLHAVRLVLTCVCPTIDGQH